MIPGRINYSENILENPRYIVNTLADIFYRPTHLSSCQFCYIFLCILNFLYEAHLLGYHLESHIKIEKPTSGDDVDYSFLVRYAIYVFATLLKPL